MNESLREQFEHYIRHCKHTKMLRPATILGYENTFKLFERLVPEVTRSRDVSVDHIDVFFERLRTRERTIGKSLRVSGVKNSTIRTYGSKLHSFFDWLSARGELGRNPVDRRALAKPVYGDKRALKRHEVEKIAAAISQNSINRFLLKRDLAMLMVLVFAGLRKTELLSLRVRDVDLFSRTLFVCGDTSKSAVSRHVPLTMETATAIEDYLQERKIRARKSEYLWGANADDVRLSNAGIKHWVDRLKRQSGVRFHLHRFRHTYACLLGRNNVSAVKIQKLLGHSDLRMTQTYLRSLGIDEVRDCVDLLSLSRLH